VINLAHTALVNVDKPVLEETYYWRGMAREALGDRAGAVEDLTRAYTLNPNSTPAGEELQRINPLGNRDTVLISDSRNESFRQQSE
jgi:hypothetical protein